MNTRKLLPAIGMLAASMVVFTACSNGAMEESGNGETTPVAQEETTQEESGEGMAASDGGSDMADPAADLVGPGCADYAAQVPDGAGSVAGMALDPVSVAASNNPLLTTLTAAVSGELNPDVNLASTLDSDEFTVFAPVDTAFEAVPEADLTALAGDSDALTTVLTYHVVPGQISPDEIVGTHTTVQGEDVEVTGGGDELMVGGAAVICGGVKTQNATVYLVDTVLMPPSMADAS